MNNAEFQVQALGDPRLAVHATSRLPVWLWSTDGTRILWANPVGARAFAAANSSALANRIFGPADQHRRQVARLAGRLLPNGAVRLERLQGFGEVGKWRAANIAREDAHPNCGSRQGVKWFVDLVEIELVSDLVFDLLCRHCGYCSR